MIKKQNTQTTPQRRHRRSPYGQLPLPFQLGTYRGKFVKHYDQTITGGIETSGSYLNITGILAGGSTVSNRVGNLVRLLQIDAEFFVSNADSTNFFKTYLVVCYNGQSSSPTFSSWYVPPDSDQYLILSSKMTSLSTSGINTSNRVIIKHRFPGSGLLVRYDTSSANTEITNRIFLVFVSDSSGAPDPTLSGYARTYFTDV